MDIFSWLSLPAAYLLGTIPSAFLVAKYNGAVDIRDEGDGKISAASVYKRVGILSFLLTVILDIGKALAAVLLAEFVFKAEPLTVLLAGALCVAGHQWSPFLRFQGGLGATVIGGTLVGTTMFPTLIGAACAAVLMWSTQKSSKSFAAAMLIIAVLLFAAQYYKIASPPLFRDSTPLWVFTYPIILGLMMVAKAMQVKYSPGRPLRSN
jgi:glycerol-3-phosphate acyltransferase PlsY